MATPLPILPPPLCPLGHGPMPLLAVHPAAEGTPATDEFQCLSCSANILRPSPDHEL